MSIFTLKQKAGQLHGLSHGVDNFSLNGIMKRHTYTGNPSLVRNMNGTPHTRFGGPQGHGGKSGLYFEKVVNSGDPQLCTVNSERVQTSVASHHANLVSRMGRILRRPYPITSYKAKGGANYDQYNQTTYVAQLKSKCNYKTTRLGVDTINTLQYSYPFCIDKNIQHIHQQNSGPCSSSTSNNLS